MRQTSRLQSSLHVGPNMTPLVDIVMVILIFLMLAGSFGVSEHVLRGTAVEQEVDGLPAESKILITLPPRIDIHVSRSASGFDVIQMAGERVSDADALTVRLRERHAQFAAAGSADEVEVVIRPAGDTAWAPVIATYDAVLRAEFKKVNFAYAK